MTSARIIISLFLPLVLLCASAVFLRGNLLFSGGNGVRNNLRASLMSPLLGQTKNEKAAVLLESQVWPEVIEGDSGIEPGGSEKKSAIEENIRQSNLAIAENRKVAEQETKDAGDKFAALTAEGDKIRENIGQIVADTQAIEQFNHSLATKEVFQNNINDNVRQLESDVAGLPGNILPSIRNEKIKELDDYKNQVKLAEIEIVADRQSLDQKIKEKEDLMSQVLARVGEGGGNQEMLDDLTSDIARLEADNIKNQEVLLNDTDGDGLADEQEILIDTDPTNPDTDGDGALDGDEISHGDNPLEPDENVNIDYPDPRLSLPLRPDIYKVDNVEAVKLADGSYGIRFQGRALANSYLAIYVYSVPAVAMVKADAAGRWDYTLDRSLNDGPHTVYVVRVGRDGQIAARSEEFDFMKTGNNVMRIVSDQTAPLPATVQKLRSDFMLWVIFSTTLALAAALLAIGLAIRRRREPGA